jgi:hypothetical protein
VHGALWPGGRTKPTMERVRGALIVMMAGLGLLAGCFGDGDEEPERTQQPRTRCDLVGPGERTFVRISGERARELCEAWTQKGAPGSWTRPAAPPESDGGFERACVVYRGRTAAGLYAADSISSVAQAKRVCGRLLARGWGELGRPDPALARDYPAPDPGLPVRCAEGRCSQGGERVSRPQTGAECEGGRWTFALGGGQNFGVYRCRSDS